MNKYYIVNAYDIAPNKIYNATYYCELEKTKSCIKLENGRYYGSTNDNGWIQIDPSQVRTFKDTDKTIITIYILLWYLLLSHQ